MNITELARQLRIPTKELREKLPVLGFDIGMRAIKVDDRLVDKIIGAWKKMERQETIRRESERFKRVGFDEQNSRNVRPEDKRVVQIPEVVTVHDFAGKIGLPVSKVITELMKNGFMATINESIDFETAAIIADDLGVVVEKGEPEQIKEGTPKTSQGKRKRLLEKRDDKDLEVRPPVVVIMGHVDHGKTSLLDAIRETNVAAREVGAITQHISAYQVEFKNRKITFIDTPGHEIFKAMRARGGSVADIAILVIAADDGVQPQTLESVKVIQEENLPFVVAINKIDKEEADVKKTKKELSEINLLPEDWGGKTICIPVSAITKKGLDELIEMILLVADMEKDKLRADVRHEALGTVIETRLDKNEGPAATILIHAGTLRTGDAVIVGKVYGKAKALRDFQRKSIREAGPSTPVEILGLKATPEVGDILEVITDKKFLRQKIKRGEVSSKVTLLTKIQAVEKKQRVSNLNLVLRADKLGSLEAIAAAIQEIEYEGVNVTIIKQGLGNITESDILQAESAALNSKTLVIGFNVKTNPGVDILAHEKGVMLEVYKIVYELLDDIKKNLEKLFVPEKVRIAIGEVEILEVFRREPDSMIIGGRVTKGKVVKNILADVVRGGQVLGRGKVVELQSNKQPVNEAKPGSECGIKFEGRVGIEVGDILEVYRVGERERTLG